MAASNGADPAEATNARTGQIRRAAGIPMEPCPACGHLMLAVRGSKAAVCANCGFKDSCCY